MKCTASKQSHSVVAEDNQHTHAVAAEVNKPKCGYCKLRLFPVAADPSGMFHEWCLELKQQRESAPTNKKLAICTDCGETILHIGTGKIVTKCRTDMNKQQVARKYARECVEKRKQEEADSEDGPPPKKYCVRWGQQTLTPLSEPSPWDPH